MTEERDPDHNQSAPPPRKPDSSEWNVLLGLFPALIYDDVWVTAPKDGIYNCLAWTLGFTDRWVWPWPVPGMVSAIQFNQLYLSQGFVVWHPPLLQKVIGWGKTLKDMTHGSIVYSGSVGRPDLWESKLGREWRITHARDGLRGQDYGIPLNYYSPSAPELQDYTDAATERSVMPLPTLDEAEIQEVLERTKVVPDVTARAFEPAFSAWVRSWQNESVAYSSDPAAVRTAPEFQTLLDMGPSIIPLVVEKLTHPENFFALQLYDALQRAHGGDNALDLVIRYTPTDPLVLEGEQGRSVRTVKAWLATQ